MIAPFIHKSTGSNLAWSNLIGSNQDCRRGCAEWSNGLWPLPVPKHTAPISCVNEATCIRSPASSEDGTEGDQFRQRRPDHVVLNVSTRAVAYHKCIESAHRIQVSSFPGTGRQGAIREPECSVFFQRVDCFWHWACHRV